MPERRVGGRTKNTCERCGNVFFAPSGSPWTLCPICMDDDAAKSRLPSSRQQSAGEPLSGTDLGWESVARHAQKRAERAEAQRDRFARMLEGLERLQAENKAIVDRVQGAFDNFAVPAMLGAVHEMDAMKARVEVERERAKKAEAALARIQVQQEAIHSAVERYAAICPPINDRGDWSATNEQKEAWEGLVQLIGNPLEHVQAQAAGVEDEYAWARHFDEHPRLRNLSYAERDLYYHGFMAGWAARGAGQGVG